MKKNSKAKRKIIKDIMKHFNIKLPIVYKINKNFPYLGFVEGTTINNKFIPTKILLEKQLFDDIYSITCVKAIILHEIGHVLFQHPNGAINEVIAQEFCYLYAISQRDKVLYNYLKKDALNYKTGDKYHRKAYPLIKKLHKKYKF